MTHPVDEQRALAILEAYGADPLRWPVGERAGVEAILLSNPRVAEAADAAARLDTALADWPSAESSPAARAAVIAAIQPARRGRDSWRYPLVGIAAALAIAIVSVSLLQPTAPTATVPLQVAEADALSLVYSSPVSLDYDEWRL
jgi:ferric-dicitrate binding protein FerR (iron transport regulator)